MSVATVPVPLLLRTGRIVRLAPVMAEDRRPRDDVTVAAAGDFQLDFLELETGGGTADIWLNGVLMKKGAAPVENRAASEDAGGWSVANW